MKLLDFSVALNPRRVRMFIAEKRLEIPAEEVDVAAGENRIPDFLAKNPLGTLPVLELDDGRWMTVSVAIDLGIPSVFEIPPELSHVGRWFSEVASRPSIRA